MKNFILFILLIIATSVAASDYGRFERADVIRYSWQYIENTKDELRIRAAAVKKEIGEEVVLNFQFFHKMDEKQKKYHRRFLLVRLSKKDTDEHISGFLRDMENVRKVLAAAEEKASASWIAKAKKKEKGKKVVKEENYTSAKMYGAEIKTKKLGVILDKSYSMQRLLPKLRTEIKIKFKNAYFIEIYGSQIHTYYNKGILGYYAKPDEGENPFEKKWHCQAIPQKNVHFFVAQRDQSNLAAIHALAALKQVDTIYWFTDMKDVGRGVSEQGVASLASILSKYNVKLYAHTVDKTPISKLKKVIEAHGEVIKKKLR
jgi:hypothetical protein